MPSVRGLRTPCVNCGRSSGSSACDVSVRVGTAGAARAGAAAGDDADPAPGVCARGESGTAGARGTGRSPRAPRCASSAAGGQTGAAGRTGRSRGALAVGVGVGSTWRAACAGGSAVGASRGCSGGRVARTSRSTRGAVSAVGDRGGRGGAGRRSSACGSTSTVRVRWRDAWSPDGDGAVLCCSSNAAGSLSVGAAAAGRVAGGGSKRDRTRGRTGRRAGASTERPTSRSRKFVTSRPPPGRSDGESR
jgi:hypothetical protein